MKKILALLLAFLILVSCLAGCSAKQEAPKTDAPNTEAPNTEAPKTDAPNTEAPNTEAPKTEEVKQETPVEPVEIEIVDFNPEHSSDQWEYEQQNNPVVEKIRDELGLTLNMTILDSDQVQLRVASGDLGDLIVLNNKSTLQSMVESDLVYSLNELVDTYAPEIAENFADAINWSSTAVPNDEGLYYCLPIKCGEGGHGVYVSRYLYTVRWDLYKQLGYPEIKNEDDYIEVLKAMQELEPQTPDGRKVYGASFFLSATSFGGMVNWIHNERGLANLRSYRVYGKCDGSDEIVYDLLDEDGAYFSAAEFYNKCYRAGILDPDCFTQTLSDYSDRITSGELLSTPFLSDPGYELAQLAIDPDTDKGFVNIPVEGTYVFGTGSAPAGSKTSYALVIPKTCKDVEAVMRLLAYGYSKEGSRELYSGVQGDVWDIVGGQTVLTQKAFELTSAPVLEQAIYSLNNDSAMSFCCGYSVGTLDSSGVPLSVFRSDEFFAGLEQTRSAREFSERYGASYPYEAIQKMMDEGKMKRFNRNTLLVFPPANEDIDRIGGIIQELAIKSVASLVTAESEEEFAAVKAQVLQDFRDAGAETEAKYYLDNWKEINGLN